MGSAATAALLRRAAKHAVARAPELGGFEVRRVRFEYRCVVPPSWAEGETEGPRASLKALLQELTPLLVELTGSVVMRRLHAIPELGLGRFREVRGALTGLRAREEGRK